MLPSTACGPKNCAWLNALKASTRNCRDFASVSRTDFQESNVVVVHSRAIEEAAARRAGRPQGVLGELGGVEIRAAIARIAIEVERASQIVGFIHAKVVDAVRLRAQQRVVAEIDQRHGKTRTETRDPGKFPALRPTIRGMQQRVRKGVGSCSSPRSYVSHRNEDSALLSEGFSGLTASPKFED